MKILLEFNETTGAVSDAAGTVIVSWPNLVGFPIAKEADSTIVLVKLGISPDDIIKLKNQDLL